MKIDGAYPLKETIYVIVGPERMKVARYLIA
jgi:hypothetical protein